MQTFGLVMLGLMTLFFGGCAVMFIGDPYMGDFVVPNLIIAALCAIGVLAILRKNRD